MLPSFRQRGRFLTSDEAFMAKALALAARAQGMTRPNPMVGAVVVLDGRIIGQGYHKKAGTDHAERIALKSAGTSARGAELYVTLEPCCHYGKTPPCTDIVIESGVRRVIVAACDPFPRVNGRGLEILRAAGVEVATGILEQEARRLNESFFTFHEKKRPFVTLKWAMSLDGRTSADTGHSMWISCEDSRRHAHNLRARHDAIAVGLGTVLLDNPRLTVRIKGWRGPQPAVVILDSHLKTPPDAAAFKDDRNVFIAHGPIHEKSMRRRAETLCRAGAFLIPSALDDQGHVEIPDLLTSLAGHGIQSILVEGGRQVAGSFVKSNLVDKYAVFIAPKIIGGTCTGSPLCFKGSDRVPENPTLGDIRIQRMGTDFFVEAYPDRI